MSSITPHKPFIWQHQADATLTEANPTSGQKYTVLDTTKNCRIIGIIVQCTWTVQPTPLEIHITIDGNAIVCAKGNPASTIDYGANIQRNNQDGSLEVMDYPKQYGNMMLEGRSVKVEAEITGGTVQELKARVKYAKM